MKSSIHQLELRGYVSKSYISDSLLKDNSLLEKQLLSNVPTERTKAALQIKNNNIVELVPQLISALQSESKLYCKIALSEALIHFQGHTVKFILPYLGKIGENQHTELPSKPFEKDSYPLPRDIVARILVNIGISVLPELLGYFENFTRSQILEVIDALGHISFYENNSDSLPLLLKLYTETENDKIMIWKLLRSFSAFHDSALLSILETVIEKSSIPAHIWEAKRSLRLIRKRH